jgi:hypothetical protein
MPLVQLGKYIGFLEKGMCLDLCIIHSLIKLITRSNLYYSWVINGGYMNQTLKNRKVNIMRYK